MDEPGVQRLHRRYALALEQERQCGLEAEQLGHAHDAAATGQQAEGYFRQAELHRLVIPGNAVVAGEANLEAPTEGSAVDGGDHRYRQLLETAQLRLDLGGTGHEAPDRVRGHAHEVIEVAAGEKHLLGRGEHEAGDALVGFQPVQRGAEVAAELVVHRVHRTAHVHGDGDDAVVVLVVMHGHDSCPPCAAITRAR